MGKDTEEGPAEVLVRRGWRVRVAERWAAPCERRVGQVLVTLTAMLRSLSLFPSLVMKLNRVTDPVCLVHSQNCEVQDSAWHICRSSVNIS